MDGFLDKLSAAPGMGWSELENKYKKGRVGLHVKIGENMDFSRMTAISPTSFRAGVHRGGAGEKALN